MNFIELWSITELRENKMSVVVLERKSIAAIKTGAPHLLWSVGRFIPTGQGHNSSLVRSPLAVRALCVPIFNKNISLDTNIFLNCNSKQICRPGLSMSSRIDNLGLRSLLFPILTDRYPHMNPACFYRISKVSKPVCLFFASYPTWLLSDEFTNSNS